MRFRSLVVWCVCAILRDVQITAGNRSRSTYHPFSDIETLRVRSPRNVPSFTSSALSFPVSQHRSPSNYTEDVILEPDEIRHQISKTLKQVAENLIDSLVIHHKRKKKCRCRKRYNRKTTKSSLLKSKTPRELKGLSTVKNLFISIGNKSDRNDSASTLNRTSESTMETSTTSQHFMDITFTTPNVAPLTINAMTIAEAARNATRETNRNSHKRYKIKCMRKTCGRRRKKKMKIIDVLDQAFFQDNLRNVRASRMEATSNSLENVDRRPIVD